MRYSIQNSGGEVYGVFPVPQPTTISAEELRDGLSFELETDLGINGVSLTTDTVEGDPVDRVVVDIRLDYASEAERIARVHTTVASLATQSA